MYTTKRTCRGCRVTKHISEFSANGPDKKGFKWRCKECCARKTRQWREDPEVAERQRRNTERWRRNNPEGYLNVALRNHYGIDTKDYLAILESQNGVCIICKNLNQLSDGRIRRFNVDHCHDTGKIRGLLCARCNSVMGKMYDDPDLLQACVDYLRLHSQKPMADNPP